MPVGIPSSNPSYSLSSVLQAQLQGLTEPSPPSSMGASTQPSGNAVALPTYNNLSANADGGASAGTLPAAPPPIQSVLAGANTDAGHLSGLISQYA